MSSRQPVDNDLHSLIEAATENLQKIQRQKLHLSDGFIRWKGGKIRLGLVESGAIQRLLYRLNIEYFIHKYSPAYKKFVIDEIKRILPPPDYFRLEKEGRIEALYKDILYCHKHFMSAPYEYFLYGFKDKTDAERREYVTDKYLLARLSMTGMRRKHDVELNDKYNFYLLAKPFFRRRVIQVDSASSFRDFLAAALDLKRMIFKPTSLGCGEGIFIADVSTEVLAQNIFDRIKATGDTWVAEELIEQSPEMAAWNESSVNTVRINTFIKNGVVDFGVPFMRTGRRGFDVDNGGVGGIYAVADPQTGVLVTNGTDEQGRDYPVHPDSRLKYKGWQIPRWSRLRDMAEAIHSVVFPDMGYISWDFALTDKGWVVIEGNWGQFVAQQSSLGRGLREQFDKYIK